MLRQEFLAVRGEESAERRVHEVDGAGFVRGHGCNFCAQTGFLERIGVYEMMLVTDTVREMILRRAPHDEIRKAARMEGMRTLQEEAARLVEMGVTAIGTDTMSPDQMSHGDRPPDTGFGVHEVVLGAGGIIAENLMNLDKLKEMQDGTEEGVIMINLVPLSIAGCDGSPVRAFAWRE